MAEQAKQDDEKSKGSQQTANHEDSLWRMRWWFFGVSASLCFLWLIVSVIVSIFIFKITENYWSFLFTLSNGVSYFFLRKFGDYLLPIDERKFRLEEQKLRIEVLSRKNTINSKLPRK